jgi:glutathione S-transferase
LWDDLRVRLIATSTGSRLQQEARDRAKGLGPPHTDALLRVFPDNNNNNNNNADLKDNVRVTLYRDQAGWRPYCQKVWLFLEQKQIPYRVKKVPLNAYGDKPAWFTRTVDGGKLPAVEIKIDGGDSDTILQVESIEIMKLLKETFPNHGPRMIPPVPDGSNTNDHNNNYTKMETLLVLEQELQRASSVVLVGVLPCKWRSLGKSK